MYSNKENVNVLTALLVKHGVRYAVVCPGSRNAPIVHNLDVCPAITCFPVTDERSAGFYALGICQQSGSPVVVCVTSGTALLNVAPAIAEAAYQHLPLVLVSADRPRQWIGQLDGQTLPQPGALDLFVRRTVDLPEPHDEESHWYCNRLVNEALIEAQRGSQGPVHINVPLTEPLYDFTIERLPEERRIQLLSPLSSHGTADCAAVVHPMLERLDLASRPLVVVGQMKPDSLPQGEIDRLRQEYPVFIESLGDQGPSLLDEVMEMVGDEEQFLPDFIIYVGDTLVSKRAKAFLRHAKAAECWVINPEGEVHDTFMNMTGVIQAQPRDGLAQITGHGNIAYARIWKSLFVKAKRHLHDFHPDYSQLLAVKLLEERTKLQDPSSVIHYANSMSVRLGNIFSWHHIFCNRGVNGIEGSLSTAAGYSLVSKENVYCVIGDLSFFYDQNALWNQNLRGNLRIVLLNNGCGGIFSKFDGLRNSPARANLVMASHHTTAEGICRENDILYFAADHAVALDNLMDTLVSTEVERPVLLEVFTDAERGMHVYQEYNQSLNTWKENGKK